MATRNPLRDRVKSRLAELGRSPIEAATTGGLERNYIDDLVKGDKESFSQKHLERVAKGLDWSISELLGYHDVKQGHRTRDERASAPIEVPEMDVRAGGAYAGGIGQEETVAEAGNLVTRDAVRAHWGIPLPFLRDELHLKPGRTHILPVRGDSMMDALFDGDRAIIDLDDTDVSQGGIFALLDDNGSVIVKQIELIRGKGPRRIRCKSRNPQYEPFELFLADPVRIIGRVACKITRL